MSKFQSGPSQKRLPRDRWAIDRENMVRATYCAIAPLGHEFENDVLSPLYFSTFRPANSRNMRDKGVRVGDRIEVRAEDMGWSAELDVRAVPNGVNEVHVSVWKFQDYTCENTTAYDIEYRGENLWTIIHDGETIEAGHFSEEDAIRRAEYLEAQNAGSAAFAARRAAPAKPRRTTKPKQETAAAE